MKIISDIGIQIPQVYLPKKSTDLSKWAVIACDQFTSQPEYWHDVEKIGGERRKGYSSYTNAGEKVAKAYSKWPHR